MRAETSVYDSLFLLGDQPSSQATSPMGNRVSTGLDLAPITFCVEFVWQG